MKTQVSEEIKQRCEELKISDDAMVELMDLFLRELNKGLSKKDNPTADVKCFITYIKDLPNGEERGKFLALDLGGTNFRVLIVHLKGDKDFEMESKIYAVPQDLMVGGAEQLFDHIADCLANFMKDQNVYDERLSLGFTFSFPLQQLGLTKGLLVKWTKGFNVAGVTGEDVVKLLKDAIKRRGDIQIDICAILNDTTGTLMSCAWKNHNCRIGLIVGTGSNACYVEKIENIEMYEGLETNQMIINTEWGALGDNGSLEFIRTSYDRAIDEQSINRGKQIYEKMISGMYMGELVRLILLRFTKDGLLFNGMDSELLRKSQEFQTNYVSQIESDEIGNYKNCMEVIHKLGLSANFKDCANVRYICECVSTRSAHLVSAGIACLINKMNEQSVTIGVDGSVYRYHPKYHDLMVKRIRQFVRPEISFDLMLSEDGSGRGAALVAAVACREEGRISG
ncbi:Hexokinase type 2 [Pseudolycoriella hygida]|uniref:Phosphotransferase n=1 Tax=Pseudolycoriella hygida TaxID=35572 RepID=A0A9Q0MPD8_9DIPT|nr:Hexokinase type 2 [Pseudolycoriella hygida]